MPLSNWHLRLSGANTARCVQIKQMDIHSSGSIWKLSVLYRFFLTVCVFVCTLYPTSLLVSIQYHHVWFCPTMVDCVIIWWELLTCILLCKQLGDVHQFREFPNCWKDIVYIFSYVCLSRISIWRGGRYGRFTVYISRTISIYWPTKLCVVINPILSEP